MAQGLRHRSRRLRRAAHDHAHVLQAGRGGERSRDSPTLVEDHGLRAQVLLRPRPARRGRARRKDVVGIAFPGGKTLGDPKNVKLRFDAELHADGRGRQALSHVASTRRHRVNDAASDQPPAGARRRLSSALLPFLLLLIALPGRLARAARGQPRRQAAAGVRHARRRHPARGLRARARAPARSCCGPTPRASLRASAWGSRISHRARSGLRHRHRHRSRTCAPACRRSSPSLSMIPPMAMLPILFIVFGLGELSKVVLIVIGIAPFLVRDLQLRVEELPAEQIIKAQTLGASTWQIVAARGRCRRCCRGCSTALRLSLGPAWLFLIAAEAIAAEDGLGYRIFLVRRYLAMDVILPYVLWITLLAFAHGPARCASSTGARFPGYAGAARRRMSHGLGPPRLEGVRRPGGAGAHQPRGQRRRVLSPSSAPPAAARPPSCACCSARSSRRAGTILLDGAPLPDEAGRRTAASCSSATRCFRTSRCSATCCSAWSCALRR